MFFFEKNKGSLAPTFSLYCTVFLKSMGETYEFAVCFLALLRSCKMGEALLLYRHKE